MRNSPLYARMTITTPLRRDVMVLTNGLPALLLASCCWLKEAYQVNRTNDLKRLIRT